MKRQEDGFTLIELLVVIAVIGVLAAIAIPVFLNQRKTAVDAALQSDIRNIATQIQTLPSDATQLAKGSLNVAGNPTMGTLTYFSKNTLQKDPVPLSNGVWWTVVGDSSKYCIVGYHTNGRKYTKANPLTYDSTAGGLGTTGDACQPGDIVDGNGQVIASGNLIKDPLFATLDIPDFKAGNFGNVASYFSAPMRTITTTTPVGPKAIEVLSNSDTLTQGIIFSQPANANSMMVKQAGEKWTVSIYAKTTAGAAINIGIRALDVSGNYNLEAGNYVYATGGWDRVSYTYTTTPSDIGSYLGIQAKTNPNTPGLVMQFAGPMVEKSDKLNPFRID